MERRRWWLWLGAIVALGLALRILGARGGLWLDEAASAVQAHDTGTPMGVFLKINHDNNHHLNSLWLQWVGLDAPPMLARALSIVTSTIAILLAGLVGARRAPLAGLLTAALFAVSPMIVTLGSEARGYAPMSVAFFAAMLLIDRWVAGETERSPAVSLALCFFLGAFCHLSMLFAFLALAGWAFVALWQRHGFGGGLWRAFRLFLPSVIALTLAGAIVWLAAASSPRGFQFGGWQAFSWGAYLDGLETMLGYTLGFPGLGAAGFAVVAVLVLLGAWLRVPRLAFHLLAILGFPLGIAILQPANVGIPRYYLLVSFALLMLVAALAWAGLRAGGWRRWLALAGLAAAGIGSLAGDLQLIRNRRADTGAAIRALQQRAPGGTAVLVARDTGLPQFVTAIASAHYPARIVRGNCPPARFVFVDRFYWERFPAAQRRCGRLYLPIASAHAEGLSGTDWTLYEARP
jgi:hypothetical protein